MIELMLSNPRGYGSVFSPPHRIWTLGIAPIRG